MSVGSLIDPRVSFTLAEKVAFLSRTDSYRRATSQVEKVETHMSWVFLTDHEAWKLKKPVCTEHVDLMTIENR
jgi:aminoglycoside phosphotransferase family enzyme